MSGLRQRQRHLPQMCPRRLSDHSLLSRQQVLRANLMRDYPGLKCAKLARCRPRQIFHFQNCPTVRTAGHLLRTHFDQTMRCRCNTHMQRCCRQPRYCRQTCPIRSKAFLICRFPVRPSCRFRYNAEFFPSCTLHTRQLPSFPRQLLGRNPQCRS